MTELPMSELDILRESVAKAEADRDGLYEELADAAKANCDLGIANVKLRLENERLRELVGSLCLVSNFYADRERGLRLEREKLLAMTKQAHDLVRQLAKLRAENAIMRKELREAAGLTESGHPATIASDASPSSAESQNVDPGQVVRDVKLLVGKLVRAAADIQQLHWDAENLKTEIRRLRAPCGVNCGAASDKGGCVPCESHGVCHLCVIAELRAENALMREELREAAGLTESGHPATIAFDAIAQLCGVPEWGYPGQVVRDVAMVVNERDRLRDVTVFCSAIKIGEPWTDRCRELIAEALKGGK